ncbi:CDP-alcohol phosphatidyltransferase family protein [Paenibacillus mesotrionivorans]|uniref:CDP-alcohol phosphatidyltransferase family protein n=1 Tax=Paenibacillus mesotrionivorans TaxID=3160968 RepID=A0ACC7P6D8_9BACL
MLRKSVPNLLTFANLSFGVLSLLAVLKDNYIASAVYIIIAALIDRYDGRIARRLNVTSDIGKELDSLADLVSFGVAPALLIFHKFAFSDVHGLKLAGVGFLLLYIISGCYRLGRYNASTFDGNFSGVPITIAGLILSVYSLMVPSSPVFLFVSVVLLLVLSILMVSKLKLKKI